MGKQGKSASGMSQAHTKAAPAPAEEAPPVSKSGESVEVGITPELVRVRAYEIFLERNGAPGDPVSDWCRAEREILGISGPGPECGCVDPSCEPLQRPDSPEIHLTRRPDAPTVGGGF